jgi:hypothetical protein
MKPNILIGTVLALCGLCRCTGGISSVERINRYPEIFPDYRNITIPPNIAPLNFSLQDGCERMVVRFVHQGETLLQSKGRRSINLPPGAWKEMLHRTAGSDVQVQVFSKRAGNWYAYLPFDIRVATDSIDPYIVYRLIDPGYELWDRMGIYQRSLSDFNETAVISNRLTGRNCINCHSFHDYRPERMMFHSRGESFAGTFLLSDGTMQRVNTKTERAPAAGTYPMWHPSGNYIAFSANTTRQAFHALPGKKIEVYDLESDLAIWDVKNGTMLRDARFTTPNEWETFPAWSPDGEWLYYCIADAKNMPFESKSLKYGLCRVAFDAATGRLGDRVDTIVHPAPGEKSVSFPRISPDNRYLLYTVSGYATFPIWHDEADLEMLDLATGAPVDIQAVNSDDADSYHAWSSNGRWIVLSSRRIDGLHTRLFFAHFDANGQIHKPFLLPQKNPFDDRRLLKSYNIPEFVKGKITISPYEISKTLNGETIQLKEIHQN